MIAHTTIFLAYLAGDGNFDDQGPSDILPTMLSMLQSLILLFIWVVGIVASTFLIHYIFSLPMRRTERARLFLDLVEDALKRGQSIEAMVVSLAQNRDRTVGLRFHMLAEYIECGLRFEDALQKVPRFLPPQISEILYTGLKFGDVKRVLPACREVLRDRPPGVRSAVHYLVLMVLLFSPIFITVTILTTVFVIPRFEDVASAMSVKLGPETYFVFTNAWMLMYGEIVIFALLIAATVTYIGGPGFAGMLQRVFILPFIVPCADWIAWSIPWKRKRLIRTFSAMLAVLLDGGVREAGAVRMAADCTANEVCRRRAARIIAALQHGAKLDDAVRAFDETGEFHWRLSNAARSRGGFLNALRGWHETLDAKAFQQEETTAHALTTGVVILNGALVALIATAMFGMLIAILKGALLL
jgi:type II secretory pathway component PulF